MAPSIDVVDEVLLFTILLPLRYSNLRAKMRPKLSCTDASEEGGASGEAKHFLSSLTGTAAELRRATDCDLCTAGTYISDTTTATSKGMNKKNEYSHDEKKQQFSTDHSSHDFNKQTFCENPSAGQHCKPIA